MLDDFDLQKIADSGQCFRCRQIHGAYRFITGKNVIYIKPESSAQYSVSCTPKEWEETWIPYFDLKRNYKYARDSIAPDGFMEKAADFGKGIRILRQDAWETLASFIISQRKSIPAIKKAVEALAGSYGEVIHTEYEDIHAFPSASILSKATDSSLADCGLGYRIPYIKHAASTVGGNHMLLKSWDSLDDTSLLSMLKTIHGVGDKVASCVMLFAYGRMSSAPVDTWIHKIIEEKYAGHNPFPMYQNNAGIMQQYAFYYIQRHKEEV